MHIISKGRLLVVAAALLVAVAAWPHRALASFRGENGRLAFTWSHQPEDVDTDEIASVDSSGGDLRPLAGCDYECHHHFADWSPSGRRIVYAHDWEEQEWIATVRADGTGRKVIVRNGWFLAPVWSPSARWIAFIKWWSGPEDELRSDIYLVRRDGTHLRRVTRTRAAETDLDWSSHNRLAFIRGGDLFTMRPDGSGLQRLTDTAETEGAPDWAPGGRRLTFDRSGYVWRMTPSTGAEAMVAAGGASPTWAPDGSRIAYLGDGGIRTVKPSGADDTLLGRPRPRMSELDWQPRPGR